jgi:hypothetical protein
MTVGHNYFINADARLHNSPLFLNFISCTEGTSFSGDTPITTAFAILLVEHHIDDASN